MNGPGSAEKWTSVSPWAEAEAAAAATPPPESRRRLRAACGERSTESRAGVGAGTGPVTGQGTSKAGTGIVASNGRAVQVDSIKTGVESAFGFSARN